MASLTDRAERAVLGAMLTDPAWAEVLDRLMPDDFADQRHRAVFTGIVRAADLPDITADQWHATVALLGGSQVSEAYLRELQAACPDPRHADAYAAMVIQARLARQLARRAGELEHQCAELSRDAQNTRTDSRQGSDVTQHLADHLAKLASAFRELTARLLPAPDHPVTAPEPDPQQAPEASQQWREEHVLSALLQKHPASGQILEFLPVSAFTSQLRQELFQAIRVLHRDGRPVDALTVDWERSQRTLQPATGTYTTRLASTPASDTPLKDAHILCDRLQRRTPSPLSPAAAVPAQTRPAITTASEQATRQPGLIQPPPAGIPCPPAPEQRT